MPEMVRRGYRPSDEEEFVVQADKLREAGKDIVFLVDRGYNIRGASVYVGDHYQLTERQRLALSAHGVDVAATCERR